jgi:DnaK suppressor protein
MGEALRSARAQKMQAALISAERKSLQARLAAIDRDIALREQGRIAGDNTPTSDTLDTVQEAMAKEEALTVRVALLQRLRVLGRAEERIREGTYGLCELCGRSIPTARLRAVPEALRCVPCAEREERGTH